MAVAGAVLAAREAEAETPVKKNGSQKVALQGVARGAPETALKDAVKRTALRASDFAWLRKGQTVFIKPVVNSANPYPATTHPLAVVAMIELLRERGAARILVGDMSGVESVRFSRDALKGSTRENMRKAGLLDAVSAAGAEVVCFEEQGWDAFYEDRIELPPALAPSWSGPIHMPAILKEADHIILMPRCSRHVIAGSTLAMKAAVGYWRHDTRLEYHRDAGTLHEKTAEANFTSTLRAKLRLVLTLADKMLLTMGPDDGHIHEPDTGLVFAAESIVAHDMVSLAWLVYNRERETEHRDSALDNSHAFARAANHVVTAWLGGAGQAILSETVTKSTVRSIVQDRVLRRAFEIVDGAPELVFDAAGVPAPLLEELRNLTRIG